MEETLGDESLAGVQKRGLAAERRRDWEEEKRGLAGVQKSGLAGEMRRDLEHTRLGGAACLAQE